MEIMNHCLSDNNQGIIEILEASGIDYIPFGRNEIIFGISSLQPQPGLLVSDMLWAPEYLVASTGNTVVLTCFLMPPHGNFGSNWKGRQWYSTTFLFS